MTSLRGRDSRTLPRALALAAVLVTAFAARPAQAQHSMGGAITNLVGSGLVMNLDITGTCVANGNTVVGTSTAAEQPNVACTRAAARCCSGALVGSGSDVVDGAGNHTCTGVCGPAAPGSLPGSLFGHGSVQGTENQTATPAAGATSYQFGDAVTPGAFYTVSVGTQPTGPAQVCTVANASGTMPGADVTNVDVSCTTVMHTVSTSAGPNGSISPTSRVVTDGQSATLQVSPDTGYVANASGCGGSLGGDGATFTTAPVTADCTVTATFTAIPKTATITTLTLAPNPAGLHQPVTAAVTVSGEAQESLPNPAAPAGRAIAANPGGTVLVSGGGQSCSATLTNGSGSCVLTYATPASFTVTASYPGDAANLASAATAALSVTSPAAPAPAPALGAGACIAVIMAVVVLAARRRRVRAR